MLFGKKKTESTNPYYSAGTTKQPTQANPSGDSSVSQQQQTQGQQFPVPLIPTPEPLTLPSVEVSPVKTTRISALDVMKIGSETKSFAFVKLSDFKRILEDIRALEARIAESQNDLEQFSKLLKEQEEYLNGYALVIKDLLKTIDEIASSLSRVED